MTWDRDMLRRIARGMHRRGCEWSADDVERVFGEIVARLRAAAPDRFERWTDQQVLAEASLVLLRQSLEEAMD